MKKSKIILIVVTLLGLAVLGMIAGVKFIFDLKNTSIYQQESRLLDHYSD